MARALFFSLHREKKIHRAIHQAVGILRKGGVVVFPTETVFGLAADPQRKAAVQRLLRIKGRSALKAMALQVASIPKALRLVEPDPGFVRCAKAFWPGPITLIGRSRRRPSKASKVGIRIPRHAFALRLLRAYGRPILVTSANPSGGKEIWRKSDLIRFLGEKADVIFWEPMKPRRASTVVDLSDSRMKILREGPIKKPELERALKSPS